MLNFILVIIIGVIWDMMMNYYHNSYYIENPIPTRLFLEEQRWYDRIISDIPVIGYDARLTRRVEDIFMLRN